MLLGYTHWKNFANVIEKAKIASKNTGYNPADHFRDINKMVGLG